ncbi:DUF2207 domain-containing protein [Paucilactobacillus nenjiangensis]|uniref:DUF2207 domain-containing protein n=3 Tax=Paucilactobacillus nenjiangensis TaxID=1296540 RepID=A0A5P1X0S9_9LACO|nr:DUF2207 domain-containing protein [Paucilactobacillus nenjiangensis]
MIRYLGRIVMKNWGNWRIVGCVLISLLMVSFFGIQSVKAADYTIKEVNMSAVVDKTGGAAVTERVTYHFNEPKNGVYIVQDTAGLGQMSQVAVSELVNQTKWNANDAYTKQEGWMPYQLVYSAQNGSQNVFTFNKNMDGHEKNSDGLNTIKIYRPTDTTKDLTVQAKFYLSSVAKKYSDTGEVNWKMIGSNWDVPIEQVKLTVKLPSQSGSVRAWKHSSADPIQKLVVHDGVIKARASNVNNFVEIHTLFNRQALAAAPSKNQARLKSALDVEKQITQRTNTRSMLKHADVVIAIVMTIVFVGLTIRAWLKNGALVRRNKTLEKSHRFDLPTLTPTLAAAVYSYDQNSSGMTNDVLSTYLMEAQQTGQIEIEQIVPLKHPKRAKKQKDFVIRAEPDAEIDLYVRRLIDLIGNGHQVSTEDIKESKVSSAMVGEQTSFNQRMLEKIRRLKIVNPDYVTARNRLDKLQVRFNILMLFWLVLDILVFLLGNLSAWLLIVIVAVIMMFMAILTVGITKLFSNKIDNQSYHAIEINKNGFGVMFFFCMGYVGFMIMGNFVALGAIVVNAILMLIVKGAFKNKYTPFNEDGYQQWTELKQFKTMLHHLDRFDQADLPDQMLWGEVLVYAVGLKEAKRVQRQLKSIYGEAVVDSTIGNQMIYANYFSGSNAFTASGSSGSSGGSGGGGGGSGGGAF